MVIKCATKKNSNHSSLIRNNVFPCICLRVITYAWSDVTRNARIRKANRATRYVGPCIFAHAFNDVTYTINEYNVHIADACYYIAAHALLDAHCVIALWRITFCAQESFNLGEWVTLTTGPPALRHIHVNIRLSFRWFIPVVFDVYKLILWITVETPSLEGISPRQKVHSLDSCQDISLWNAVYSDWWSKKKKNYSV